MNSEPPSFLRRYAYAGFVLRTPIAFPELPEVLETSDLEIPVLPEKGSVQEAAGAVERRWTLPDGTDWAAFSRTPEGWRIDFAEYGAFTVAGRGDSVHYAVPDGTPEETLRHLLLNQILPLALSARGRLTLHASAVELAGRAAVFAAASGGGKSTLALHFATAGERFLSDDLVVVDGAAVIPSYPALRVRQDTLEAAGQPGMILSPGAAYGVKTRILASKTVRFGTETVPFGAIFLLGEDVPEVEITRVDGAEAALALVESTFVLDPGNRAFRARHFDQVSGLAALVPVFRLRYPRDFERLDEVRHAVAEQMRKVDA